jgi:hypothetical protein
VRRILSYERVGCVREHALLGRGRAPQDHWHYWHGVRQRERTRMTRHCEASPLQQDDVRSRLHPLIHITTLRRIGTEVAHRARGFHMNILYHNRSRRPVRFEVACLEDASDMRSVSLYPRSTPPLTV